MGSLVYPGKKSMGETANGVAFGLCRKGARRSTEKFRHCYCGGQGLPYVCILTVFAQFQRAEGAGTGNVLIQS